MVDFEKAFDLEAFPFFNKGMNAFNFGSYMVLYIKIKSFLLLEGWTSLDGYWSNVHGSLLPVLTLCS
jgi:hypothetical protein